MEDHVYEDPDNDPVFAKSSYPIKTERPRVDKGAEKKKKNEKKGLSILKNFKKNKKSKQDCADPLAHSVGHSKKSLGKGYDETDSSTNGSGSNYYIKDGRWVARIVSANQQAPAREETKIVKHKTSSAPRTQRKDVVQQHDSSPSPPPPLPNRQYLQDTAFLAELEGSMSESYYEDTAPHSEEILYEDTAPHSKEAYYEVTASQLEEALYEDTAAPHSEGTYYEDVNYNNALYESSCIEEDADNMEGYVDVTRNEGSEDSDEYIETDQLRGSCTEYVNVDRGGGYQSDDSDDYVRPDVY